MQLQKIRAGRILGYFGFIKIFMGAPVYVHPPAAVYGFAKA
jgi:hypothetical protein